MLSHCCCFLFFAATGDVPGFSPAVTGAVSLGRAGAAAPGRVLGGRQLSHQLPLLLLG